MKKVEKLVAFAAVSAMSLSLTGCMIVASPAVGGIFTEVKYGDVATTSTAANKEGKACAQSILGWVATGDASVTAAKNAGGITNVSTVDHTAKNILGIIGEWCTVVRGS
jgi:TRL-like protein family